MTRRRQPWMSMTVFAIALIAALVLVPFVYQLLLPFGLYRLLFCASILLLPTGIRAYQKRRRMEDQNTSTDTTLRSLQRALVEQDLARVKHLKASHGSEFIRQDSDPDGLTSIHVAAAAGSAELVLYLLGSEVGADPRCARINAFTPLHAAAMKGHAEICEILIRHGANVDTQTIPQRYAPLHSAAFAGHLAALRVLLDHGADVGLRNHRDETPAMTATRTGQLAACDLLNARPAAPSSTKH